MTVLILASGSAGRLAMLRAAGVAVEAQPSAVDEDAIKQALLKEGAGPRDIADSLAEAKAIKVSRKLPGQLVLGCDQILVTADGTLLDKPSSPGDAISQLGRLSGATHKLISAAVLCEGGKPVWRVVDSAKLSMRELSSAFVGQYVEEHWPQIRHSVGCYRIEAEGAQLFSSISGSQFTIIGLPLLPVLDYLRVRGDVADMIAYADVIGHPIGHSKSPLIHRFWLERLGLIGEYHARDIPPENLGAYFADRRDDPAWRGCNITIPHKITALEFVADPGGVRDSIGAINVVFRDEAGVLTGTNSDAGGFYGPIADWPLVGETAVVIGSGGAARAVLFALAQADVGEVVILARNALRAAALLAHFGLKGRVLPMDSKLPPAALLVNASPLGMKGQEPLTLDLSPLPGDSLVYDLVYAPIETALLKAARARELETVDGLEMLVGQAAIAFELFFGHAPPDDGEDELRAKLLA